jgi:murein DD-endopeptidase MepM/ murein hydrolase activator NlpD
MQEGVAVLAAARGIVLRVRDGVQDHEPAPDQIKKILASGRGCGNGAVIDHGGGWQSLYCHMKQGSVVVTPGQVVQGGDAIGKIGQSGAAEFPHLHFTVLFGGKRIDPFTGAEIGATSCGAGNTSPLWQGAPSIDYSGSPAF